MLLVIDGLPESSGAPVGRCFQFDVKQALWTDVSPGRPTEPQQSTTTTIVDGPRTGLETVNSTSTTTTTTDPALQSELEELSERNKALQEENRLLKLKIEILMEMVTETTAELNLKDKSEGR
ncbi:Protein chibby 1 [Tyrophagus putrescentiae]|nr:Protein chibby 1 [Tyrophagus putrescentiae]